LFGQFIAGRGDLVKYSYKEYRLGDGLLTIKEEKKILIKTEDAKEEFGTLVFPYDDINGEYQNNLCSHYYSRW